MIVSRPVVRYLALILILLLAAYLRLANHTDNPGWYTDEGTHIEIAQNLVRGRVQYMVINQSTLLFARMPLFEIALAGLLRVWFDGIGTLRAFTGALGVLSVGMLFWVVWRCTKDSFLALLSALMLAIYPQAVLYSRFGFSYNLLVPLMLLAFLGFREYLTTIRKRWLMLAAGSIGIGITSDLTMSALVVPLVVVVISRRWRDLLWSLPVCMLPFGIYTLVMILTVSQPFFFDLQWTFSRLSGVSLADQFSTLALNYTTLISQDFWMLAGVIGLFLLRPLRLQRLSLLLLISPIVIMGRTEALYNLSFYYMIPLLPLVALGVASLIKIGVPYVFWSAQGSLQTLFRQYADFALHRWIGVVGGVIALLLIVGSPFIVTIILTLENISNRYQTAVDPFLLDAVDGRQVALFVNDYTKQDDLVVASPGIGWSFDTRTADYQMVIASREEASVHLPENIPQDRFAFDPHYTQARLVVVDNLWHNWAAVHMPGVLRMLRDVETWPLVFQAGAFDVYENPEFQTRDD